MLSLLCSAVVARAPLLSGRRAGWATISFRNFFSLSGPCWGELGVWYFFFSAFPFFLSDARPLTHAPYPHRHGRPWIGRFLGRLVGCHCTYHSTAVLYYPVRTIHVVSLGYVHAFQAHPQVPGSMYLFSTWCIHTYCEPGLFCWEIFRLPQVRSVTSRRAFKPPNPPPPALPANLKKKSIITSNCRSSPSKAYLVPCLQYQIQP